MRNKILSKVFKLFKISLVRHGVNHIIFIVLLKTTRFLEEYIFYSVKKKITYIYIFKIEKAMAPHSGTLALKIPWVEEPGRLQSMGSQSQTRLKRLSSSSSIYLKRKKIKQ